MSKEFGIGTIFESFGKFAKVINVRNGIYGLSGWTTRKDAEKATVAHVHMNGRALRTNSDISIVSSVKSAKAAPAKADTTAAAKKPAKAAAKKSTIAKPAVRKAAKRSQAAQKPAKKVTSRKSK